MLIEHVDARAVYDSNGYPALEAVIRLEHGIEERAIAPRGSTVGQYEGVILEDMAAVPALSCVDTAVNMVRHEVRPVLMGLDATEQAAVDAALLALDCTPRKERVGANVCIAVSMAAAKAGARSRELPLYAHLQGGGRASLPAPMFNVFDGAADTHCAVAGIEFLLLPTTQLDTRAALEMAVRVRRAARTALSRTRRYVGDSSQGALVVDLPNCEEGLVLMQEAAIACGYEPRHHFHLGLDLAAADYVERGQYVFPWASDAEADWRLLLQRYLGWQQRYPLRYIEDAYAETDDEPWRALCAASHPSVLIVGDDLFASSAARLERGARERWANAVVVKPNQVGTVTEALAALARARTVGLCAVVSQRSGENDDAFLTHLAVAGGAQYLKAGGMSRMDRVTKFNELLRLSERSITVPVGASRGV